MLSVRLDEATEQRLSEVCRQLGRTKSEVVKESLAEWLERLSPKPDPYELGKDLFGRLRPSELPEDPLKREIWEQIHARHDSR